MLRSFTGCIWTGTPLGLCHPHKPFPEKYPSGCRTQLLLCRLLLPQQDMSAARAPSGITTSFQRCCLPWVSSLVAAFLPDHVFKIVTVVMIVEI